MTIPKSNGIPISRDELLVRMTDAFLDGEHPAGAKLPSERQLAEHYGVSRPVVREVMQRLKERGLIHIAPGSGAYLREPSALDWARPLDALGRHRVSTTRELVEARLMLETRAVSLAAERADQHDIDQMRRALNAFAQATDLLERARCDIAFHSLVARASHNPVIEMMFGAIAPLVFEVMLRSLSDSAVTERGAPLHQNMLDAIVRRDPVAAAAAVSEHLTLASTMFGSDFDAPLNSITHRKNHSLFGAGLSLEEVIDSIIGE